MPKSADQNEETAIVGEASPVADAALPEGSVVVDAKTLARAQARVDHALDHGLLPGDQYVLEMHNDPSPVQGTLLGTSDLGALFQALGSRLHSFHPWSGVKGLTHTGQ